MSKKEENILFYVKRIVHEQMVQEAMEHGHIHAETRHKKRKQREKLLASYQRPTSHPEGAEFALSLCAE